MTITPFGYFFFGSVFAGILLTIAAFRRRRMGGKKSGFGASIYFGLIIAFLSSFFFMFVMFGATTVYNMVAFPKFEATVIGFESAWEEFDRTDSDGNRYKTNELMHTPTLRFTDADGQVVTLPGNVRSGAEPVIGSKVTVAYKGGALLVISVASVGLMIGLAVMLLIIGYILLFILYYAAGWDTKRLVGVGGVALLYLVVGGGMLAMLAAMLYGIYSFFLPGNDMPVWAFIVCCLFSVTLVLAFLGMFVLSKRQKNAS